MLNTVESVRRESASLAESHPGWRRWVLALGLEERLEPLRHSLPGKTRDANAAGRAASTDSELARRRQARWRGWTSHLADDRAWQHRLAAAGITERELEVLLGESPEDLALRHPKCPAWVEELRAAYQGTHFEPFAWPSACTPDLERHPFVVFAEPLVHRYSQRLAAGSREVLAEFPDAPFTAEGVSQALLGQLPNLLAPLLARVMVVELQAARLTGQLVGDDPRSRFQNFLASLRTREVAEEILWGYPRLARNLVNVLDRWCANSLLFLRHLGADAPRLATIAGQELGRLTRVEGGISDPHRGGKGVLLLDFEQGPRLVYKPRSLGVEAAFQELLIWLNDRGWNVPFRAIQVLDMHDHGWCEFVEPAACGDEADLRNFYRRQGAYAALMYLLDGTDIHHENLIAAGEHPVLIDLETLFQPWVEGNSLRRVEDQPNAALRDSALRSGLLPQLTWSTREHGGVDISGAGARDGQLTPMALPMGVARGTDEMRFERQRLEVPVAHHRPTHEGRPASLLDHAGDFEAGFAQLLRFVADHRREFLQPSGPLATFASVEIRVLFRPTIAYGTLLYESYHPHLQANAIERDFLFDTLWTGTQERPYLETLIPAEFADLREGDVPSFYTRPDSIELWTSRGDNLGAVFDAPPLEQVRERLRRLDSATQDRQLAAVHASLEAVRLNAQTPGAPAQRPSYPLVARSEPASCEELLQAARAVGQRLMDRAFHGPRHAYWLSVEHAGPQGWRVTSAGPDLYLGLPGVVLFLAQLGELTGDKSFTEMARRGLQSLDDQLAVATTEVQGLGAWNGWGGLLYTYAHLALLWRDETLWQSMERLLPPLEARVAADELLDVVAGSAGLLLVLLEIQQHRPSSQVEKLLRACGDRLVATAREQEAGGYGWPIQLAGGKALAGFSHGSAGIALALFGLAQATGDETYRRAALRGLEYERTVFSPEEQNWFDLRVDPTAPETLAGRIERVMTAWCHGAAGLGLARVRGLASHDDAQVRDEIAVAIRTTLEKGLGQSHCLCHGDLGNLDFLLEAARVLEDPDLRQRVGCLAGGLLDGVERNGYLFGLQSNVETPSVMVGLAGIGYGFLRLASPDRVPCLLASELPRPAATD